jgi:SAM-dependent methyltransferase
MSTLQHYDRWSRTYDHIANPLVAATAWVLDRAPLACTGLDVIELGCGTGRNAERVLEEGARHYTGVDGSPGMLAVARARSFPADRVAWVDADLHAPWAPAAPADLAFVVLVIEHLTELDSLARTLAASVRPGGRARIVELHPERIANGSVAHFRDGDTEVVFPSIAHPVEAVVAALERAGFVAEARTWLADDALTAAVPRTAKHAGKPLVLDVTAVKA